MSVGENREWWGTREIFRKNRELWETRIVGRNKIEETRKLWEKGRIVGDRELQERIENCKKKKRQL